MFSVKCKMDGIRKISPPLIALITKPWFISMVITVILFFLLPIPNRYLIQQIRTTFKSPSSNEIFYDLNNDGNSEKICFNIEESGLSNFIVYDGEHVIDQWVVKGKFVKENTFFIGNYDNNKLSEIYIITQSNDSILLNIIEPCSKKIILKNLYLSDARLINSTYSTECGSIQLIVANGNPPKELLVSIFAGYSYVPRRLAIIDIDKKKVNTTPSYGVNFFQTTVFDIDNDGKEEIFGKSPSFGNTPVDYNFNDQIAWLYFYNSDLSFYFKPIEIGKYPSKTDILPFKNETDSGIVVLYSHFGLDDSSWIGKYDLKGRLIKKVFDEKLSISVILLPNIINDFFYTIQGNGLLYKFDNNLNMLEEKIVFENNGLLFKGYISNQNLSDYIFSGPNGTFILCASDFSFYQQLPLEIKNIYKHDISINYVNGKKELVISGDEKTVFLTIKKNFFYLFRIPLFIVIFLGLWGLTFLVYYTQKRRVEKHYESTRRITELQIKSLYNQLDPHFTLNLINSIGGLFATQKADEANYYFGKYAKMLREMILSSDKIDIPLKKELEYCKNYLQLEQFRLNHQFDFKIEVENDALLIVPVPRLLIHTFIENSVKHGIRHLTDKKGNILISVKSHDGLKITVKDNGIGREKTKEYSLMSTGKGLHIVDETLKLYNSLRNVSINYSITDIYNEDNSPAGTKVEININREC
jgi:hypothetical protein